jgi:hypothetical protein
MLLPTHPKEAIMSRLGSISTCALSLLVLHPGICQAEQPPQIVSELLTSSPDARFEKIAEILFNNNYVILAANQQLALITFRTQSEDYPNSARRRVNVLEGTLLLRPAGRDATRIQVKLTRSWQESNDTAGTFRTGVQHEADADWYKNFFNMLGFAAIPPSK